MAAAFKTGGKVFQSLKLHRNICESFKRRVLPHASASLGALVLSHSFQVGGFHLHWRCLWGTAPMMIFNTKQNLSMICIYILFLHNYAFVPAKGWTRLMEKTEAAQPVKRAECFVGPNPPAAVRSGTKQPSRCCAAIGQTQLASRRACGDCRSGG